MAETGNHPGGAARFVGRAPPLGRLARPARSIRLASALFALLLLAGAQAGEQVTADGQPLAEVFARDQLTIVTAAGRRETFAVYLALDDRQHARGLMFVRELPERVGMLFLNRRERPMSMWMKDTYISLDMLFIDRDGRIVHIAQDTVPHSLSSIRPPRPVLAVLELNAGLAARLGIALGDRVEHPAFAER